VIVPVVSPNGGDRALAQAILAGNRMEAEAFEAMPEIDAADPGIGCLVLVEEALSEAGMQELQAALHAQPSWSDLQIILIAAHGGSLPGLAERLFPESGNVTLLERPIHPLGLVSAVSVALRARARQVQVRDLLAQNERAVRQRDEFLAMLAHELRNPLAPISNSAYILGTLEHPDPLFAQSRAMIVKQVRHIARLVDDLLDVSRLELGKVELRKQRVNLNESVAAAVESSTAQAAHHCLVVRLAETPLPVRADPVRIEQAICNLIVNATKFTPAGGSIEVEAARDGDSAVVSVTDNGVGIKPEMLESIFELFTQDSTTLARTQGGLGIGLTLVRRLVELHGGKVQAYSAGPGSGSRFEARFALDTAPAEELPAAPPRGASRSRRVLIVEDANEARESLGVLVKMWKHEVILAANGPEGVERALESRPDVALVDIGLPGFDGYEVAQRIRGENDEWARAVRLVALTGYGQQSDRDRALAAGFDLHIRKPVDPAELRALLA